MKDKILKIAGVKSEAAFYKKFPTEAAFKKAHGKELKKAQIGASIAPSKIGSYTGGERSFSPNINYAQIADDVDYSLTGMNQATRMQQAAIDAKQGSSNGGTDLSGIASMIGGMKKGGKIEKYQSAGKKLPIGVWDSWGGVPNINGESSNINVQMLQKYMISLDKQDIKREQNLQQEYLLKRKVDLVQLKLFL